MTDAAYLRLQKWSCHLLSGHLKAASPFICRCLPPDRTWHKVKSLKAGNKLRLEPCWSMLLIGSLGAMWAWWGKQFHKPKCGSGHVCRVTAWTRQQGLAQYIGLENVCEDLLKAASVTFTIALTIIKRHKYISSKWLL